MKKLIYSLVLATLLIPAAAFAFTGQKIVMPYAQVGSGWWSGLAITNITNATQDVGVSVRSDTGVYLYGSSVSVPAYGLHVDLLENFFSSALPSERVVVTLTSSFAGTNTFHATLFMGNDQGGFGFQNYSSTEYTWDLIIPPIILP